MPHSDDWNGSHIGTNLLVTDALGRMGGDFTCLVLETEYWRAMLSPNLMIESNEEEVADLVAATACHAGEVARNPYHLGLPAWMQDNVRRGSEILGGQGGQAADFGFATLYRLRRWKNGGLQEVLQAGRSISSRENVGQLLSL